MVSEKGEVVGSMGRAAKFDLLRFSISYTENRIQLVDNKAGILMAIQAGLFGIITWTVDKLFLSRDVLVIPSYVLMIVTAVFAVVIMGFLLQTIRPVKWFLSLYAGIRKLDGNKGIMWGLSKSLLDDEEFPKKMLELSDDEIELEYVSTLFAVRQLVVRKYTAYRHAVQIAKVGLLFVFTSLIVLIAARIANQ
jgi:hypothetical protein